MAAYYATLGFAVAHRYPDYLIVRRDDLLLHFWLCADRHVAENSACCLHVADVRPLFAELETRGIGQLAALETKPWGMLDFALVDPNGNLLRIGESL